MKEFSNVAFQPVPVQQNNIPYSTSFVQQQQQQQPQVVYYYYPSVNVPSTTPLSPHPPQVKLQNDDEILAKQLQAQFDQESRV